MRPFYQRTLLMLGTGALLMLAGWSCFKVHRLSGRYATLKKDYSMINNIGNDLLSVEVWRDHFVNVMTRQIDEFELSPGQADTVRNQIEKVLNSVIDKVADTLLNEKKKTIGGKLKKFAAGVLINEDKVREKVPGAAQTILDEILKPENREKLKALAKNKLKEMGASTYDSAKREKREKAEALLRKYNVADEKDFNRKSKKLSDELKQATYHYTYVTLGVILLFLLLWWLLRNSPALYIPFFIASVVLALEVLLAGLTTPMIEIDARIQSLDFKLIGTEISFNDQVIFFQSKSIVDVVNVLLKTGKYDSILVGILILVFSIVFPISKLLSTGMYLLGNKKWKKNKLVDFFAFKSGKWSMADVNVIAIFMAYIGFKGILDDQLSKLNMDTETLTGVSTNQTSLQPGYILFIGFVLFGLVLSMILNKITHAGKM